MSDIIKKVQYEINQDGNCSECKSLLLKCHYCKAFDDNLTYKADWQMYVRFYQLNACKDFLAEEKAKQSTIQSIHDNITRINSGLNDRCKMVIKEPLLAFENVITNIISCRVTGERKLLDLTLPITKENLDKCMKIYGLNGRVRVTIEIMD